MNFLKKFSIRNQLFILAFLTMVLVALSMMIYYSQVAEVVTQKNSEYTSDIFQQVKQSVASNCDVLGRLLSSVAYNPTIQDYMMETNALKMYELSLDAEKFIAKSMMLKDGILDIAVIGINGNIFNFNSTANYIIQNNIVFPERNRAFYLGLKPMQITNGGPVSNAFIIGTSVFSIDHNSMMGQLIGSVALIVDIEAIIPQMESLSLKSGTEFYLLDSEGTIFASKDPDKIGSKFDIVEDFERFRDIPGEAILGDEKAMIRVDELGYIEGSIVGITPEYELLGDVSIIRTKVFIILAFAISLLSIPFTLIIRNILMPIIRFKAFIGRIKDGNLKSLKKRIHVEGYSEIAVMAEEFNSMLDEIDSLTNRLIQANGHLYKAELLKKQAELSMLQSQINPHFLYNTLESVKGMALAMEADNIVEMTKSLARIFKYAVKGADFVTLKEELDILKAYIQIQQVRFQDRFDVEYRVDQETLWCSIPRMILQPIVENAIHHGLEMLKTGGSVCISAHICEGQLVISFRDNGVGMDQETLARVRNELQREDSAESQYRGISDRIGIQNVNSRIKIIYGDDYGIQIESEVGQGTEVVLKFPVKVNENL